jgi:hypothetical protein
LTDHAAIRWLFQKADLSGRHAWWQMLLSEFDYEIETRPGQKNGNADSLNKAHFTKNNNDNTSDLDDDLDNTILLSRAMPKEWISSKWYKQVYIFLATTVAQGESTRERQRIRRRAIRFAIGKDGNFFYRDSKPWDRTCDLGFGDVENHGIHNP